MGELIKFLRGISHQDEVDAILVTGDIAYSGRADQYERFKSKIIDPLLDFAPFRRAKVITVPGNHDVDCDASLPIDWHRIGEPRQRIFFDETPEGAKLRKSRAASFKDYSDFISKAKLHGPNPIEEVSSQVISIESATGKVNVLCTNTAFFSDKELGAPEREREPAPTPSLRARLLAASPADCTLVLGHHPIDWFIHTHRQRFKSLLVENRAIYLHGHTHQVEVQNQQDGLMSLGFGATYQGSLDGEPSAFYTNTFAICELKQDLHIVLYHWDTVNGRWVVSTGLPNDFRNSSNVLPGGYILRVPHAERRRTASGRSDISNPVSAPVIESIISIGAINPEEWISLIVGTPILGVRELRRENFQVRHNELGRTILECQASNGRHLVDCISGRGHVLSRGEVESANTQLDSEDLASYTIVSVGEMADDARTLYLRLQEKKALKVLSRLDFVRHLIARQSLPQSQHLQELDGMAITAELILTRGQVYLLVTEKQRRSWFYVVDENGGIPHESDEVVRGIRAAVSEISESFYRARNNEAPGSLRVVEPRDVFDPENYLKMCHGEFNSVRYTALAAIGLRFNRVTLAELYVDATACPTERGLAGDALLRAINEALQGLPLDESLRAQLESQIRSQHGLEVAGEPRAARALYQEHGSVLVLGDPGSGKTCFVKREILAYCERGESWYQRHIPIFVPLVEAARIYQDEEGDLIRIACTASAKRGLRISPQHAEELVAKGAMAFFFDGLDEVVSIDRRAQLVDAINALMDRARPMGNRFVLTSRPAAVQVVEPPKSLKVLSLRGLTPDEMRVLATRLLAMRYVSENQEIKIGAVPQNEYDANLVEQLLRDCEATPGIARLARNPLLLTLLVMIYANSGPLAAKRHRVYAQAIQTLVSVRSREAGQRVISETDLRRRLGAVAYSVYDSPDGGIPVRADVRRIIGDVMQEERTRRPADAEVDQFIQDVAESTGLIAIHNANESNDMDTMAFMHHSFLEYYAAIGLASMTGSRMHEVAALARKPRWREVITLLAGIMGDTNDAYPLVDALLQEKDPGEEITCEMLLFAFDCALECDVPPESAQQLLLKEIDAVIRKGVAKYDAVLRGRLGERVGRLLAMSGSRDVATFLVNGIESTDVYVCAAFVDILGHVAAAAECSDDVMRAYLAAAQRFQANIMVATCAAMGRAPRLRDEQALRALRRSIEGSAAERYSVVKAIQEAPGLAKELSDELIERLDDTKPGVAQAASVAVANAGIGIGLADERQRRLLFKVLCNLERGTGNDLPMSATLRPSRAEVDALLSSPSREERLLGLRILPWLKGEEQFVFSRAVEIIRSAAPDRDELVAALATIRMAWGAQKLLKVADIDKIQGMLEAQTRDVRIAACDLLGKLQPNTDRAGLIRSLIDYVRKTRDLDEYECGIETLVEIGAENESAKSFVVSLATKYLRAENAHKGKDWTKLNTLLRECVSIKPPVNETFVGQLRGLFRRTSKVDPIVKRNALAAYVSLAQPEPQVADLLIDMLVKTPVGLDDGSVVYAVLLFTRRCRRKFEYVRDVYPRLNRLLDALVAFPRKEHVFQRRENDHDYVTTNLRVAVEEVLWIIRSHDEFARRKNAMAEAR